MAKHLSWPSPLCVVYSVLCMGRACKANVLMPVDVIDAIGAIVVSRQHNLAKHLRHGHLLLLLVIPIRIVEYLIQQIEHAI